MFPPKVLFVCSLLELLLNFLIYHAHSKERLQKYGWNFSSGKERKDELFKLEGFILEQSSRKITF